MNMAVTTVVLELDGVRYPIQQIKDIQHERPEGAELIRGAGDTGSGIVYSTGTETSSSITLSVNYIGDLLPVLTVLYETSRAGRRPDALLELSNKNTKERQLYYDVILSTSPSATKVDTTPEGNHELKFKYFREEYIPGAANA